jgi:hypothetical protein
LIKVNIKGEYVTLNAEEVEKAFRYIEELEREIDVIKAYAKAGWDVVYKPENDRIRQQYTDMLRKLK